MLKAGHGSPTYIFQFSAPEYLSSFDTIVLLRVEQLDVTVSASRRQLLSSQAAGVYVQHVFDSTQLGRFDAIVICIAI